MSSIITSAAFFWVCECGGHGHIVFSDGSKGVEVCSIQSGLQEFGRARDEHLLIKEELPELRRQICYSDLAQDDRNASLPSRICVEFLNDPEVMQDLKDDEAAPTSMIM